MQLHELKPKHKSKRKKRVGRGGKRGTYSGRGLKGQRSRAGRRLKPAVRELIKKYPKLRGYRQKLKVKSQRLKVRVINVETLEKNFSTGAEITPEVLLEKKIIDKIKGKVPKVKILGNGKLTKVLTLKDCLISKQAREKIEKARGNIC